MTDTNNNPDGGNESRLEARDKAWTETLGIFFKLGEENAFYVGFDSGWTAALASVPRLEGMPVTTYNAFLRKYYPDTAEYEIASGQHDAPSQNAADLVPSTDGEARMRPDLTPSKEDYKTAWQMQHPNAMGANWPGIPGNPYPLLADHLCCMRKLEEAEASIDASYQRTNCAFCGKYKQTPVRCDTLGGYVCAGCLERAFLEAVDCAEKAEAALATAEESGARKISQAIRKTLDIQRNTVSEDPVTDWGKGYACGMHESKSAILALLSGEGTRR